MMLGRAVAAWGLAFVVGGGSGEEAPVPWDARSPRDADLSWEVRALAGGDVVSLDEFRGRVIVVHAWASWCAPCIRELPTLEGLRDRVRDTDVVFVVVAMEREASARSFVRRTGVELPWYVEHRRMPASWRMRGVPSTWIVDREGQIVLQRYGATDWDSDEVEGVLRGLVEAGAAASGVPR